VRGERAPDKGTPSKLRWCGAHMYISFRLWVQLWIFAFHRLATITGKRMVQSVDFRQPLLLIPLLCNKTWHIPSALPGDVEIVLYCRHLLSFLLFSKIPHFFDFYYEILCACFSLKLLWPLFFFVQWPFFFGLCIRRKIGCPSSQVAPFHTG
jgi:hypothetical protein